MLTVAPLETLTDATTPSRGRHDLVLHLHGLEDQQHVARLTDWPAATFTSLMLPGIGALMASAPAGAAAAAAGFAGGAAGRSRSGGGQRGRGGGRSRSGGPGRRRAPERHRRGRERPRRPARRRFLQLRPRRKLRLRVMANLRIFGSSCLFNRDSKERVLFRRIRLNAVRTA